MKCVKLGAKTYNIEYDSDLQELQDAIYNLAGENKIMLDRIVNPPLLRSAVDETLQERGKTHGDFRIQASCAQELKYVFRDYLDKAGKDSTFPNIPQEAIDMILHKIARIAAGDHQEPDHWKDIAGYATLVYNNYVKEEVPSDDDK